MRVPLEWLYEYCNPQLDAFTLAERLAATGTEVERVEHHGVAQADGFVVGRVLTREKHLDADRLNVCTVDVGEGDPVQIVCAAPNVDANMTVGVVRPGARMPDGTKIKKAKLRGVESSGMILSERELQISGDHDGIMVLSRDPADAVIAANPLLTPGSALSAVVPISTDVLVLEITPNRPDCLGIYGVAREVAATTGAALAAAPWEHDEGTLGELEGITITVEDPQDCLRFTARIFEGVKIGPSPAWMKARLMACGQRPISNVVDVTNYVMMLTGQPMHAFDYDRVAGQRLNVRRARPQEPVQTLDEQTRELDDQMVVIEDADGPTSIAGVMGGARSEVHDGTTNLVSEVATWSGPNIHRTGLKLALRSEASTRNEKGLQPEQALWAQAVATKLFVDVCGASVRPGTIDIGGRGPALKTIRLRDARVEGLLGVPVARERSKAMLETIGFVTSDTADGLDVTVPDFRRADVTREADLIEEVARLDGVDKLPATLPARRTASGALTPVQRQRRRAADALTAQGINEMIGWSFVGPDLSGKLRLAEVDKQLVLANPMSSEQSEMRTTLLGSMLDAAQRNRARGLETIRLFELGSVYMSKQLADLAQEPQHLAAILIGPVRNPTWRDPQPLQADFFAAKGALGGLLDTLGATWLVAARAGESSERQAAAPFLHPGRSAEVFVTGEDGEAVLAGWVGEIHPSVAASWELEQTVAAFEVNLDAVPLPATTLYRDVTSFPAVNEDLAVVVSTEVTAAQVLETVRGAGGALLADAAIFDVYRDEERLGAGNISLAVRFSYQASDRTLTVEEVAKQRQKIIAAVEQRLGGKIRG